MNLNRKLIKGILLLFTLMSCVSVSSAQERAINRDKILVAGEYPLTQSKADRLAGFFEWLFDAQFTTLQREKYQRLITDEWSTNKKNTKGLTELLVSYEKIESLTDTKREDFRRRLLPELVAELEKANSEIDRFLLGVYRASSSGNATGDARVDNFQSDDSNDSGGTNLSDLAGVWSTSSVSGERYRSLVTGELSDPNGSIIEYKISPGGEIKHVGYLSSTVYSCTTKLFISRTGRVSVSGSNITFDFSPGKRIYQTCSASASRNDTLPAEKKTYPFRIERAGSGLKLCTIENGKDFCLYKKSN